MIEIFPYILQAILRGSQRTPYRDVRPTRTPEHFRRNYDIRATKKQLPTMSKAKRTMVTTGPRAPRGEFVQPLRSGGKGSSPIEIPKTWR